MFMEAELRPVPYKLAIVGLFGASWTTVIEPFNGPLCRGAELTDIVQFEFAFRVGPHVVVCWKPALDEMLAI
jgi:hypothetical protein